MALFKHSYSGLITGGLGMPACCGLITMGFSVFKCTIEIVNPPKPPSGGGGGGHVPVGRVGSVPLTRQLHHSSKLVTVTVQYKDHKWKKTYTVEKTRAKIVVSIVNFINKAKKHVMVGVDAVRKLKQRVAATFSSTK